MTVKASVTKNFWLCTKVTVPRIQTSLIARTKVWLRPDRWIRVFGGVQDITLLADVLQLPVTIRCHQRTTCDRTEALCMLLKRFSYPCRYSDMIHRFARPVPEISMITNTVMDHIFLSHGDRISQWNCDVLSPPMLQEYADVIHGKGAPLNNCFGFIDGTVRPISRPGQHQRIVYNGHKRVHSLKLLVCRSTQWAYWKYVWACW